MMEDVEWAGADGSAEGEAQDGGGLQAAVDSPALPKESTTHVEREAGL